MNLSKSIQELANNVESVSAFFTENEQLLLSLMPARPIEAGRYLLSKVGDGLYQVGSQVINLEGILSLFLDDEEEPFTYSSAYVAECANLFIAYKTDMMKFLTMANHDVIWEMDPSLPCGGLSQDEKNRFDLVRFVSAYNKKNNQDVNSVEVERAIRFIQG